ncbi:glutathione S-transferase theta-1 isoform X2 [Strongylocentrotus purpuratus]|uniref:Glutathione transferase n=1 Tax=Strongylocentrotus purpuratus TaxID=7668 RepID=A0A7M7PAU8_STRPU|nr:glutathione S-transferase theta-1 isoform X2 [Strongylocentrotus purpuratus]|eukprot:XP_011678412.1 PREDICTED: glutathione S-transferase theta-1 isoform X4 [Strongylocentrotus purpuratus]
MSVKIFYDLMSQPARSVLMFARANKIPYTPCPIAMRKSEHQSEEYAAVNPMKKIPAMQDGEFKLTESVSITKYLHEKFDCADHWFPKSLQQRSRVNEYLDWQHFNTRPRMTKVFLAEVIFPRMTGTPADPAALAPDIQRMEETLDNLEKHFLKDKPFLCGDDISIADLFGVNEVIQVEPCGYGTIDRRPKLKAWIGRVREHVQPEIFDDVCQLIYKLAKAKQKL